VWVYPGNNGTSKKGSLSPSPRTRRQQITTTPKNNKCSGKKLNQMEFPSQSPKLLHQEKFGGQYQRI